MVESGVSGYGPNSCCNMFNILLGFVIFMLGFNCENIHSVTFCLFRYVSFVIHLDIYLCLDT
jgi:hypothetical protein